MHKLIILNFTMDSTHPLLSHQPDVAKLLAKNFDQTTVLTAGESLYSGDTIKVLTTRWVEGQRIRNVLKFYKVALPVFWAGRKDSAVFSHMTDVQSALIGPVTKLLGIPHYLWYAHTHKSWYLRIANFFVDMLLTSTLGSCPIKSGKVQPIGQAIDENVFEFNPSGSNLDLTKGLHVGRFDPSKKLDHIFSEIKSLRSFFPGLSITQIGSPSTRQAEDESQNILKEWDMGISEGWIIIRPSIKRKDLPSEFGKYDVFFHSYIGSLDKTLIEATMSGLPVVTINPEYLDEFGSWSSRGKATLQDEFMSIVKMNPSDYVKEIERRYTICLERHSRARWVFTLTDLLLNGTSTSAGSGN